MKKIGFVDYSIDEWHANNYPRWIRGSSLADKFEIALAWEKLTLPGRAPLTEWCSANEIGVASSLEQLVAEVDAIIVLAPSNPEMHEELADLPLQSGKPVYVDKTFAPTLASAKRMFDKAEKHGTPLMSTSALRYPLALEKAVREEMAGKKVHFVSTRGGGRSYDEYAVHQFEMMVMAIGTGATRVKQVGNEQAKVTVVDYADGRRGLMNQSTPFPFQFAAYYGENQAAVINDMGDFFPRCIESILRFFDSGKSEVPKEQTLEVIALVEAGVSSLGKPDQWVAVPK